MLKLCLSAATEVVTVFVFQEPSLLSSLQDNGLTDVMLHALLIKDVRISRHHVLDNSNTMQAKYILFQFMFSLCIWQLQ